MKSYNNVKLQAISEKIGSGMTPLRTNTEYWNSKDIPWVKTELLGQYIISETSEYISQKAFEENSLTLFPANTLSIAMYGEGKTRGNVSIFGMPMTSNQACCNLIIDEQKADYKYVYYALKNNYDNLRNLASGVRNNLNADLIKNFEIPLPDLPKQKKIADVLSCIDDKIALNNKTNTELENMAKTIYDYWFTQFDFPDKNGHPYKTSGGQMVYNEILKREIPAGWEVKNILDCCKVIDCLHSKKPDYCYEDENCYLLQLENLIDLKLIDLTNKYYVSKKDYETWTSKTKVKQGDLVVTNAGRVGGVSRIPNYIETGIGRNMTSIRPISISEYLLCYFFSSSDCDKQIRQNTDQGAFFQSLNVKGIKKLNLTIPPKEIQEKFDSLVGKIRLQIESNHKENEELTKLRDYLLPLLMNGQIKVK